MNHKDRECDICKKPYFERNNYFFGKLMTTCDFFAEQRYFNDKRWLVNKMTIGAGVVCGLQVETVEGTGKKITVNPGMAIDHCGREIVVCEPQTVELPPWEPPPDPQQQQQQGPRPTQGGKGQETQHCGRFFVFIRFHECKTDEIPIQPVCDEAETCEFNRIRDSFKIEIVTRWEPDPVPWSFCPHSHEDREKSMHQYLCDRLLEGCPHPPGPPWVLLAEVNAENSGQLHIDNYKRQLVYPNPMLYDLIHCFHGNLPHIVYFNWQEYHGKHMQWNEFKALMEKGLTVTFDKEMDPRTINRHTFLFAVLLKEAESGYLIRNYIPCAGVSAAEGNTRFTFEAGRLWVEEEIDEGGHSSIRDSDHGVDFEIVLRSDSIVSTDGRPLDGQYNGGPLPSGCGTPGSVFTSWFHLESAAQSTTQTGQGKGKKSKKK
ncbi:MAG: hypothetical protein GY950_07750 [bacterium]|nr:hypothetical protein [bacterium]